MEEPVLVDKLNELNWLNEVVDDTCGITPKYNMGGRVWIPRPQGELLPAEDRLANVLKAIETRLLKEREALGDDNDPCRRAYISGLDIAWSLAQTEILRRTDSPT